MDLTKQANSRREGYMERALLATAIAAATQVFAQRPARSWRAVSRKRPVRNSHLRRGWLRLPAVAHCRTADLKSTIPPWPAGL